MTEAIYKEMIATLLLWVEYQKEATYAKYTKAMDATYAALAKLKDTK